MKAFIKQIFLMFFVIIVTFLISLQLFFHVFVFSQPYYDFTHNGDTESMVSNAVIENAKYFFLFLQNEQMKIAELPFYEKLTQDEKKHWVDVKELYTKSQEKIVKLTIILFSFFAFFPKALKQLFSKNISVKSHILFFGILSSISVILFFFFSSFWKLAHTIVFEDQSWLLPVSSITIQSFPLSYFIYAIIVCLILSILQYMGFFFFVSRTGQREKRTI